MTKFHRCNIIITELVVCVILKGWKIPTQDIRVHLNNWLS
nr:MAG TPA: hypothetical protein [Caudoviricetes sp.]